MDRIIAGILIFGFLIGGGIILLFFTKGYQKFEANSMFGGESNVDKYGGRGLYNFLIGMLRGAVLKIFGLGFLLIGGFLAYLIISGQM